jgi:FkbM family methyltransferase
MDSSIKQIINFEKRIDIVDIGAAHFESTKERYQPLLDSWNSHVIGFEPHPNEYQNLIKQFSEYGNRHFLPYAIADGKEHELKLCRLAGCSSLLEPNLSVSNEYPSFGKWMEVVDRKKIKTRRLDDISEIGKIDLLKLDTQGSELMILENAREKLKSTQIIECEVEFISQYEGQPHFSQIELFLRELGFQFHSFLGYGSRMIKPFPVNDNPLRPGTQWLWSDAVFIRNSSQWNTLPTDSLFALAIILADVYEFKDFTYKALKIIDSRNKTNYSNKYLDIIIRN